MAVSDFLTQIVQLEQFQALAKQEGLPALERLYRVAHNDTGQALCVRRFLLGLYNGQAFPFNLNEFRGLDTALFTDCMKVLAMDASPEQEIHRYFENGAQVFRTWAEEHINT